MSELSPEARELIESTIHVDDPSDADRARMRARLAAQLGAAAVASTLGAAHSTMASASGGSVGTSAGSLSAPAGGLLQGAGGLTGLFKVAVVTGLAGIIGGSVAWFSQQPELGAQPIAAHAHGPVVGAVSPLVQAGGSRPDLEPTVEALPVTEVVPEPAPAQTTTVVDADDGLGSRLVEQNKDRATNRRGSRTQESQPESTLGDELALLARAQQALRDGNPTLALDHATQHLERFPHGSLREERFGIEALARCALGHDGSEVVASLARLSPSSPLLIRVRAACGISP